MKDEINKNFNPINFSEPSMISINNVELEVFEAGRLNAGKPIIFCHDFPEHAFSWRHQRFLVWLTKATLILK